MLLVSQKLRFFFALFPNLYTENVERGGGDAEWERYVSETWSG